MIQIKKCSKEQIKRNVVQGFNFPDDDPQADLLRKLAKTEELGFEILCEQCKLGNLKVVPFEVEEKCDEENIDFGWNI